MRMGDMKTALGTIWAGFLGMYIILISLTIVNVGSERLFGKSPQTKIAEITGSIGDGEGLI